MSVMLRRTVSAFAIFLATGIIASESNAAPVDMPQARYQLHVISPTEAVIIDTFTGCLDRVRFFDTRELVTPVTGYPDEDKIEEALRNNPKSKPNADGLDTHSCAVGNRNGARNRP